MTNLSKIPDGDHFAILTETSRTFYTPGDERSVTHPGHGYPESSETVRSMNYEAFTDEAEWKFRIEQLIRRGTPYKALFVKTANIKVETKITY